MSVFDSLPGPLTAARDAEILAVLTELAPVSRSDDRDARAYLAIRDLHAEVLRLKAELLRKGVRR